MTSKVAARLIRLYPRAWRIRYGAEFAALLEEHSPSFSIFANVLWSAVEAHMHTAILEDRSRGKIVASLWSAWMLSMVAGLVLYGLIDDSALPAAMDRNAVFVASWRMIQAGCVLAGFTVALGGLPVASSLALYAARARRWGVYLRLATPFLLALALVSWVASALVVTKGHWAASPWAVTFSHSGWPSQHVRWITGSISAVLMVTVCLASAACIAKFVRTSDLPELRIGLPGIRIQVSPLSFAGALAPLVSAGIFLMLAGTVLWGCSAMHFSEMVFRGTRGPLGLPGLASWILSTVLFALASAISAPILRRRSIAA